MPEAMSADPKPADEAFARLKAGDIAGAAELFGARLADNPRDADPQRLKAIVFSTRPAANEDEISRRIAAAAQWRRVGDLSDAAIARAVMAERIDILFDMSGHTSGGRLPVFAHKPAPIQISWIGYVGTTGLGAIDYILGDARHAPDERTLPGVERCLRMPNGYVCFDRVGLPPIALRPPDPARGVTFGCLNNPAKLNDRVIESFAHILARVPNSQLILRFRGLDDPAVANRLKTLFQAAGIANDRIDIRGGATREVFLATYNEIDIALDTFPYSGGLTTCEALAMGVPVLTFPGATFAGRHATSHLFAAGVPELSASDRGAFEQAAIDMAMAPQRLQNLRQTLASLVANSKLCDAATFAMDFEHTLRAAWRPWCTDHRASTAR